MFPSTHHHSEVLQGAELGKVLLQSGVQALPGGPGVLEEGPELLQTVQLAYNNTAAGSAARTHNGAPTFL